MFKLALGILLIALGLSMGVWSWLLNPSPTAVPFVGLAVVAIGALLVTSSLRRRQKPKIPTSAVVGGAVAAATAFALLQGVLKEVEQKQARERALAAAKLAELEQQYHMYKDRLTPEQRQFFEQKIAEYKRQLSGA